MTHLVLATALLTPAAWGGGACPPVGGFAPLFLGQPPVVATTPADPVYTWRKYRDDEWHLFRCDGSRQVQAGGYRPSQDLFLELRTDGTWHKGRSPVPVPVPARGDAVKLAPGKPAVEVGDNFGIDVAALGREKDVCSINGRAATREDLVQAVGGSIPDDRHKPFLTVLGSEADCDRVLKDLESHPALKGVRERWHVQSYRPDNPMVAGMGFAPGSPALYLQGPNGKVLHRQDGYRGPEELAEAVRKADPDYKPERDPDLNKVATPHGPVDWSQLPAWAWGLGAAVILLLVGRKASETP